MSQNDGTIFFGPDLEAFRAAASQAIMNHYVKIAESDMRPPTQRAMDSVKLQEAYRVQAGQPSTLISREAALRNVPVADLVGMIVYEGQKAFEIELARVNVGLKIEAATDYIGILAALKEAGVELTAALF